MKFVSSVLGLLLISSQACGYYNGPRSSYYDLKRDAQQHGAWAVHTIIDLKKCCPQVVRSTWDLERCINEMCYNLGVRRIGVATKVYHEAGYGYTSGYTVAQQASNHTDIVIRVDERTNNVFIDVCSAKLYDAYALLDYLDEYFGAYDATIDILFRK